jgi:hypothetical protein
LRVWRGREGKEKAGKFSRELKNQQRKEMEDLYDNFTNLPFFSLKMDPSKAKDIYKDALLI